MLPLLLHLCCAVVTSEAPPPSPPTASPPRRHRPIDTLSLPDWPCNAEIQLTRNLTESGRHMTERIESFELGWNKPPAQWLSQLCPSVVEHFTTFPLHKHTHRHEHPFERDMMPILTSDYAAQLVCTLDIVQTLGVAVGAQVYLYAGSQLAALVHGQPIPWDDDADTLVEHDKLDAFLQLCKEKKRIAPNVTLRCHVVPKSLVKIWLEPAGSVKETIRQYPWRSPFVDLFTFIADRHSIYEVTPSNKTALTAAKKSYALTAFFPTRPYFMGGVYFLGPRETIARGRYSAERCRMGGYSHRTDAAGTGGFGTGCFDIDCCRMSKRFPFVYGGDTIFNGNATRLIFPSRATAYGVPWHVPGTQRDAWAHAEESQGPALTAQVPHLDQVEVDNSIAPPGQCVASHGQVKVVEFNAERGRYWLQAVPLLRGADVIILNEMDIGMARSGQQHTARLLAHMLGMNYAWGLEFVELTQGNRQEQRAAGDVHNFHGLHGNAFLTRCAISDPVIFRDPIGKYFSDDNISLNALGYEKRLGGRMGLFGRIQINGRDLVIGSTHTLSGFGAQVRAYINGSDAVTAGDQVTSTCSAFGLEAVDRIQRGRKGTPTWPASCRSTGKGRGDNICSNLHVAVPESAAPPCYDRFGLQASLSDHAPTAITLRFHNGADPEG
jgi:hypothetical protein